MTKIKLFKSPLIEDLESKVNEFLNSNMGNLEYPDKKIQRTLKDIQYVKDISDSAVMVVYEEIINYIY